MFDKLIGIKDETINRIKNVGLVRGIEIASGAAVLFGAILVNLLSGEDITENYEPEIIDVNDAVVEDTVDEPDTETE